MSNVTDDIANLLVRKRSTERLRPRRHRGAGHAGTHQTKNHTVIRVRQKFLVVKRGSEIALSVIAVTGRAVVGKKFLAARDLFRLVRRQHAGNARRFAQQINLKRNQDAYAEHESDDDDASVIFT